MRMTILASMIASGVSLLTAHSDLQAEGCTPATCANAPAWKEGVKYKKGDRVIGARGNLWQCKGNSPKCGGADYEPDVDVTAPDAWQLVESCFSVDTPEVSVSVADVVVVSTQCGGSITLRALVVNDSPFGGFADVAFYHSTNKVLIGVARNVTIPPSDADPPFAQVDMIWNNPTANSALVTVVADDDGTGKGNIPEANETDNAASATLTTCPP
jgi:hypothetical protein